MTDIFLTDNIEWSSKHLWKMISTDVKANKNNKKQDVLSKIEIQYKRGMRFSFDSGWFYPFWYFPLKTRRGDRGGELLGGQKLLSVAKVIFKKTLWPILRMGSNCLNCLQSHFQEAVYFLPLSSQKFLVLICSTSEEWKAELDLESPSSFEHGTPRLRTQRLSTVP